MGTKKSTASKTAAKSGKSKAVAPAKASASIPKDAVTRSGANKKEFYEAREKNAEEAANTGRKLSAKQIQSAKQKTEEHDLETRPVSKASEDAGYYGAPREMGLVEEPIGTTHRLDGMDEDEDDVEEED